MSPMLEKIARAICGVEGNNECEWPEYVNAARGALLAMREPDATDDDIARVHCGNTLSWDCDAEGVRFIRAAMIDAILAGETET